MKFQFNLCTIIVMFTNMYCIAQDVIFVDYLGNTGAFPREFIDQNKLLKKLVKSHPNEIIDLDTLSEKLTLVEFRDYYANSFNDFKDTNLKELVRDFTLADKLGNDAALEKLKWLILEKIEHTSPRDKLAIQAKNLLKNIQTKTESLDTLKTIAFTNKPRKKLDPQEFQNLVKKLALTKLCHDSLPINVTDSDIEYTTIIPQDTSWPVGIEGFETACHYITSDQNTKIISAGSGHNMGLGIHYSVAELDNATKQINWNTIYMLAFDVHGNSAFVTPNKIAVLIGKENKPYFVDLHKANLNDKKCTHLVFSHDSKVLTAVFNKKAYIIDYEKNTATPINLSMDIFSSIILKKGIILLRSTNGNTYTYNLKTNKLKYIPEAKVDFYTYVTEKKQQQEARVEGITQDKKVNGEDIAFTSLDIIPI